MRAILVVGVLGFVSACSPSALREARMDDLSKQCQEYGLTVGTEAHKNCVMQADIAARNR